MTGEIYHVLFGATVCYFHLERFITGDNDCVHLLGQQGSTTTRGIGKQLMVWLLSFSLLCSMVCYKSSTVKEKFARKMVIYKRQHLLVTGKEKGQMEKILDAHPTR